MPHFYAKGLACGYDEHKGHGLQLEAWAELRLRPVANSPASDKAREEYYARRVRAAWRMWRDVLPKKEAKYQRRRRGVAMHFFHVLVEYVAGKPLLIRGQPRTLAAVLYQRTLIAAPDAAPFDVGDTRVGSKPTTPPQGVNLRLERALTVATWTANWAVESSKRVPLGARARPITHRSAAAAQGRQPQRRRQINFNMVPREAPRQAQR